MPPRDLFILNLGFLVFFASLLFPFLFLSADNESMVCHTVLTCPTRPHSIRKFVLFDTRNVPPRRFTHHDLGLFTTSITSTARPPQTLQIRPHARLILPRDRFTELVNRLSLPAPSPRLAIVSCHLRVFTPMRDRFLETFNRSERRWEQT